jgi:hypothetical protein
MPQPHPARILSAGCAVKLTAAAFLLVSVSAAAAFDPTDAFPPMTWALSAEGTLAHFETARLPGTYINCWNVGARISLLPFGVVRFRRFLHGGLDGALELGLEPTFARFNGAHQNFAGLIVKARYHLVRLRYGRFLPWIGASIGPGYSDLNIGQAIIDTKLEGPFMALITGEAGVEYFVDTHHAIYVGLQAQHFSNAGLNGRDHGSSTNVSLNTPWGIVAGYTWFFR